MSRNSRLAAMAACVVALAFRGGGLMAQDEGKVQTARASGPAPESSESTIKDLSSRFSRFKDQTAARMKNPTLPPKLKVGLVRLAKIRAQRIADPESDELAAAFHEQFAQCLGEFNSFLTATLQEEEKTHQECEDLQNALQRMQTEFGEEVGKLRAEAGRLGQPLGDIEGALQATAKSFQGRLESGQGLNFDQDNAVAGADAIAATLRIKGKLGERRATEREQQILRLKAAYNNLEKLRNWYRGQMDKARNSRSIVTEIAKLQRDRARTDGLIASLKSFDISNVESDLDITKIPDLVFDGDDKVGSVSSSLGGPVDPVPTGKGTEILKGILKGVQEPREGKVSK